LQQRRCSEESYVLCCSIRWSGVHLY
jgi:hypothetical protein